MSLRLCILIRVGLAWGVIATLVACGDADRLLLGLFYGAVIVPLTVFTSVRTALKIGKDEGESHILADLVTRHIQLHNLD